MGGISMRNTTKEQMYHLKEGDVFYVNDERHIAWGDSHRCGDSSYDGFIVYDTNGEAWFEEDFDD